MKNLTLIILSIAILSLAGCGETATNTTNAGNTAAGNNTAESKSADPKTTSDLNPDSVDPEKPLQAEEFNKAVSANPEAWKGKKVAVTGSYFSASMSTTPDKPSSIGVIDSKDKYDPKSSKRMSDVKEQIVCSDTNFTEADRQVLVKDMKARDDRIFKGTVKEVKDGKVYLEPCEFVKK